MMEANENNEKHIVCVCVCVYIYIYIGHIK